MSQKHSCFKVGDQVTYDGSNDAFIVFVDKEYIVVCTHQSLKHPDVRENSLCPYNQVNVLVYPHEWHSILPRIPPNVKSFPREESTVHSLNTGCDRTIEAEA
jgi:hypothetical protein